MPDTNDNTITEETQDAPQSQPSNEELAALLNEELTAEESTEEGSEPAPESVDSGGGEAGGESYPSSATTSPTTPTPTQDTIEISPGVHITREDAERYYNFERFLQDNPEFTAALQGIRSGEYELVAKDAKKELTPPENLDLDDPATRVIWDQLQALNEELNTTKQSIAEQQQQITSQYQQSTDAIITRATESFQKDRSLNEEDMQRVIDTATALNVLPGLTSPTDPRTGLPRKVDILDAVEKSLELAYWTIPEFREAEVQRQLTQNKADNDRKRKASALSGSSGSTTKDTKAPTTREEINAAMINEVAAAMFNKEQ